MGNSNITPLCVTKEWYKNAREDGNLDPEQIYLVDEEESIEVLKQKVAILTNTLELYANRDNWGKLESNDTIRAFFFPIGCHLNNGWKYAKAALKKIKDL